MASEEKNARAFIYLARLAPEWITPPPPSSGQLNAAIRDVAEHGPGVGPPLRRYGSDNHREAQSTPWSIHTDDWRFVDENMAELKRKGLSELGPIYILMTAMGKAVTANYAPEPIAVEARAFLTFLSDLFHEIAVPYPSRLELLIGDEKVGHDRTFRRVGPTYVPAIGSRAIFGGKKDGKWRPGLGWSLENLLSAWLHRRTDTPRIRKCLRQALKFKPSDWNWAAPAAYNFPWEPHPNTGWWLRTDVDVLTFEDGSKLIVCAKDTYKKREPVMVVDAQAGGVCRFLSPVKAKSGYHTMGSKAEVIVDGGQVFARTWNDGDGFSLISRERPIGKVTRWRRLTKPGWQDIDPATQEPIDGPTEPPVDPPVDPPTEPPSSNPFLANCEERLDNGNVSGAVRSLLNWAKTKEGEL